MTKKHGKFLAKHSGNVGKAVANIAHMLAHPQEGVRIQAVDLVTNRHLADKLPDWVQGHIVDIARQLQEKDQGQGVANLLAHSDIKVCVRAVRALGEMRLQRYTADIFSQLQRHDAGPVLSAAVREALGRMVETGADEAHHVVQRSLTHPEDSDSNRRERSRSRDIS